MKTLTVITAAAAAALITAGAASAQSIQDPAPPTQTTTPSGPIDQNQKRSTFDKNDERRAAEQEMKVERGARDAGYEPMPAYSPADQVAYSSAQPTVVTNGPVLDTAENRAKYPPMSRAGKQTAARGN